MQASALSKASLGSCKRIKSGAVCGWYGTRELDSPQLPLTTLLSSWGEGRPSPPSPMLLQHSTAQGSHAPISVPSSFLTIQAFLSMFACVQEVTGVQKEGIWAGPRTFLADKEGWIRKLIWKIFLEHLNAAGIGAGGSECVMLCSAHSAGAAPQ